MSEEITMDEGTVTETETTNDVSKMFQMNLPVQSIDINSIKIIPSPLRKANVTDEDILDLAKSLKAYGVLNKFCVVMRYDGDLGETVPMLADGDRRLTALKLMLKAGEISNMIDASILPEDTSDIDILSIQVRGNAGIKKTADKAYVDALYQILYEKDFTHQGLADYVGDTKSHVVKLLKTINLPANFREALANEEITMIQAQEMVKPVANMTPEMQEAALNLAVDAKKNSKLKDFSSDFSDFSGRVTNEKSNKVTGKSTVFVASPKFIGVAKIKEVYASIIDTEATNDYESGRKDLLLELFEMDSVTVKEKEDKFNEILKKKSAPKKSEGKKIVSALDVLKKNNIKGTFTNEDGEVVDINELFAAQAEKSTESPESE